MNYGVAMLAARQSAKVRRACWPDDSYVVLRGGSYLLNTGGDAPNPFVPYTAFRADRTATDWEVIEE